MSKVERIVVLTGNVAALMRELADREVNARLRQFDKQLFIVPAGARYRAYGHPREGTLMSAFMNDDIDALLDLEQRYGKAIDFDLALATLDAMKPKPGSDEPQPKAR